MSGGRFTDLPGKLRRGAELIRIEPAAIDLGDWLWITGVMHDAALKIESLERDEKRVSRAFKIRELRLLERIVRDHRDSEVESEGVGIEAAESLISIIRRELKMPQLESRARENGR